MTQSMKSSVVAFISGVIFAIGLGVAGMTQPSKVIGFLRVVKDWDMTLVFVMVGAIGVHFFAYVVKKKMRQPIFDQSWHVPTSQVVDRNLVLGAVIFGLGWGIGGYCPGPAITALATLNPQVILFVASMVGAMMAYNSWSKK